MQKRETDGGQAGTSKIDFSRSGNSDDLDLPDGMTFEALKDAARIADDYEHYINEPRIPSWVHGDGDSAIMLVLRDYEMLAPERARPR
ncbi:MAG: hypothetical protein IIA72_00510 [Proteobacteria bacterium]|nr:hypothetical protein [Pseudomonadota bacterium]